MNPRAVSVLVDLLLWALPVYVCAAAVLSRWAEHRRHRAVAAARAVTPPVMQSTTRAWRAPAGLLPAPGQHDATRFEVYLAGPVADMTDEQMARLLDDWSTPEQQGPAA